MFLLIMANYTIYGDNTQLESIGYSDFNIDDASNQTISAESYMDKAATKTHTFILNEKTAKYYFVGSIINSTLIYMEHKTDALFV